MESVALCHPSAGAVRAGTLAQRRRNSRSKQCCALIGVCVLAAVGAAITSSVGVFCPGARVGQDLAKHRRNGVQRRVENVQASVKPVAKAGNTGAVGKVATEEAFRELHGSGDDVVVMLTFPWCRTCRFFKPTFKKLAKIYEATLFTEICGNENDFTKHYAREVLNVEFSPMFALYSGGKMVKTWTGGCHEEFVTNVEKALPSANGRMRQALVDAGYA